MPSITIRAANQTDIPFIRAQYVHVEETGAPHWRQAGPSPYTDAWIDNVIQNAPDDQAIVVAADESGVRLGYTWVLELTEFDAIEPHGHIAGVGVASEAAGRGVGRALIAAAEAWCRDQHLGEVTLHCYLGNERSHRLYQHLSFENEWYHMRKGL
ncbi:MAG: GNAT family N-acetyltransferase [Chloroflexota bacterium]|nr:GNAT family N-acetyltransferase [Chloroflexota bacterium]